MAIEVRKVVLESVSDASGLAALIDGELRRAVPALEANHAAVAAIREEEARIRRPGAILDDEALLDQRVSRLAMLFAELGHKRDLHSKAVTHHNEHIGNQLARFSGTQLFDHVFHLRKVDPNKY